MTRKWAGALPACALIVTLGTLLTACDLRFVEPHARVVVREPALVEPAYVPDNTVYYLDERHHGAVRNYYYYPGADVYFDPIASDWFWLEGRSWRHGRRLPGHIRIDEHSRRSFRSDAGRPYEVHERVRGHLRGDLPRVPDPRHVAPAPRHIPGPPVPPTPRDLRRRDDHRSGVPVPPGLPRPPLP